MGILDGKTGLIFGVANERSIAWQIALQAAAQGAECAFSFLPGDKMEARVRKTLSSGGMDRAWIHPCDVSSDEDLDRLFAALKQQTASLDFVVHSIAYADRAYLKPGMFAETPRDVFANALDISAYTLIAITHRAIPFMANGGSILALSYYGAEKAAEGYNAMGVAKSALESTARYLAAELGRQRIRVNCLSAGPCRTLSAMAVGGIDTILKKVEESAPLRRNIETSEVGTAAAYLLSDLSSGVTGETHHVDAGYHAIVT
ncbi:MAG TPA: enoyl-ACP reductase [Candidatus Acetothermia bacterium]|nr:enoyl-ACP reductase [Candidatus Acetothermia bacterium]